jgi:ParE toxin of type II toxin-antitoxin system, parDE
MLRFAAEARRELFRVSAHYDRKLPGRGDLFLDDVSRTLTFIKTFPEARADRLAGVRFWPLEYFPYSVLYAAQANGSVVILAVGHAKRGPHDWKSAAKRHAPP